MAVSTVSFPGHEKQVNHVTFAGCLGGHRSSSGHDNSRGDHNRCLIGRGYDGGGIVLRLIVVLSVCSEWDKGCSQDCKIASHNVLSISAISIAGI